jgi:hypothetical protein
MKQNLKSLVKKTPIVGPICKILNRVFLQLRGSSRNFMGRGEKIESAAVEEDSGAVVEGVTETTGIGLEGLDFGVEALGHGVGDGEKREVEQSLQMLGQHLEELFPSLKRQLAHA